MRWVKGEGVRVRGVINDCASLYRLRCAGLSTEGEG